MKSSKYTNPGGVTALVRQANVSASPAAGGRGRGGGIGARRVALEGKPNGDIRIRLQQIWRSAAAAAAALNARNSGDNRAAWRQPRMPYAALYSGAAWRSAQRVTQLRGMRMRLRRWLARAWRAGVALQLSGRRARAARTAASGSKAAIDQRGVAAARHRA